MPRKKEKAVLFLGSGLSAEFGLPTTQKLEERLLETPGTDPGLVRREQFITERIREFWAYTFGWRNSDGAPSLEDHFTQIDLAANSGHHLGPLYSPKKLRAIRRMTVHRIFKLLDLPPAPLPTIDGFIQRIAQRFGVTFITTNWDIMLERCLQRLNAPYNYGAEETDPRGLAVPRQGVSILKLHGSGNWGYCDCCRNLITFPIDMGKIAVHLRLLLEPDDFRLFDGGGQLADDLENYELRRCGICGGRWGARVATFSYRKDLGIPAFQQVWDLALSSLRQARRWLLVGYSMPEADIEIRHLLKTAQLARKESSALSIRVILKDDPSAGNRYQRFFGLPAEDISDGGLDRWIQDHLGDYCGG